MVVAQNRRAFGRPAIGDYPLLRRQLMKIMLPTEQALSMYAFSADTMRRANAGDKEAANLLRILTPFYKSAPAATTSGRQPRARRCAAGWLHQEWVTARLVRDAQIGTLWEGTSNIICARRVQRASRQGGGHKTAVGRAEGQIMKRSNEAARPVQGLLAATPRSGRYSLFSLCVIAPSSRCAPISYYRGI